jgi:hypothetical protein
MAARNIAGVENPARAPYHYAIVGGRRKTAINKVG